MGVPRRQRFPDRFVDDIAALVCAISADIAGRYHKVLKTAYTVYVIQSWKFSVIK